MSRRRRWEIGSVLVLLLTLGLCAGYVYYRHLLSLQLKEVLTPPGSNMTGTIILSYDTKRAMELVRQGASVSTRGHNGVTVLGAAVRHANYDFVEELLRRGADVNTRA